MTDGTTMWATDGHQCDQCGPSEEIVSHTKQDLDQLLADHNLAFKNHKCKYVMPQM